MAILGAANTEEATLIEPVQISPGFTEAQLATCLEAAAGLLAPAAWMHDPSLALRAIHEAQRAATSSRLHDACQLIVDAWAAAQEPALAMVVRGDLPYSEAPAPRVAEDNVVYLSDRRPLVGMIPEANRSWDPLDPRAGGEEPGR